MSWKTAARHPEWWIDMLVGYALKPSDAVVVSGFWRSGTTWLQQVIARTLNAKVILEPLRYSVDAYRPVLDALGVADRSPVYLDPLVPYAGSSFERHPKLKQYVRSALVSAIPGLPVRLPRFTMRKQAAVAPRGRWSRSAHRIAEAFRPRVVVKFTRAHLLLHAIANDFGPRIVHVRRDPRAVVHSFRRIGWTWPQSFSLVDHLLEPDDGRAAVFREQSDLLRTLDTEPPHVRIAAYWGLLETQAQQAIDARGLPCFRYRDLVKDGTDMARRHLAPLIGPDIDAAFFRQESWSSMSKPGEKSIEDRLYGWKDRLSSTEIADIESAVHRVGADVLL